nr:arsenate reductase 2.2 [Quercus suber]
MAATSAQPTDTTTINDPPAEQPWHASFPAPTLTAPLMPARRAQMILSMKIASMLIIDVRRTDYEGGSIRGSLNVPAQGFWWNRGMLYELAYKAGMEWVVFTCGSSRGRGVRCAAWFLEFVRGVAGDADMNVMVLEGGVKGWVKGGPQFTALMDGFEAGHWERLFREEEEAEEKRNAGGVYIAMQDVARTNLVLIGSKRKQTGHESFRLCSADPGRELRRKAHSSRYQQHNS